MQLDVIEDQARLDALAREWDTVADAHGLSPFQTFAWQRAWWTHVGRALPDAKLHVVVARDGREIAVIAPLMTERVGGLLGVRRLAFLGRGMSDYLDVLARPEPAREALGRIVDHLAREVVFDVGFLEEVSDRSPTLPWIVGALRARGLEPEVFVSARCPRTQLHETWEKTLSSFSVERRREARRRRRNLEKAARVELEIGGTMGTVDDDVDEFIAMHQERWTATGQAGALADPNVQAFHRTVARELAQRGRTFFGFLRADGRRIAALYGFRWRDELAIYLTGQHDPGDLRRHSPGRVLTTMCMERAIAEGASVYDFMRGTEAYKYELEGKDVLNRTVMFFGRGALAAERFKLALLGQSLERRASSELLLWRHVTCGQSIVSSSSLQHVARRARCVVQDGLQKLKQPAAPVTLDQRI